MIFKVQKRKRRVKGKVIESEVYHLRYRFGDMPCARWKALGLSDKEAATRKAEEFRREWEGEAAGVLLPRKIREGASKSLEDHLVDYVADLKKRGKSGRKNKGGVQTKNRLERLFRECGWRRAVDVTTDSFLSWRSSTTGLSPRTLNHYLGDSITFLNWLERSERITINPLRNVSKVEEKGRETRLRRAFSDKELARLIKGAPHYRGIAYLTAARTGLRHGELAQLKWGDMDFDSETPHVLARAGTTKNKKDSRIPLTRELEAALLTHKPDDAKPTDSVFPKGVPRARTLKKDLEKVGVPFCDEQGRYADFHSLRYSWATHLQRQGVNSRMAMELMRHSDRKLTDKIYTDVNLLPLGQAVRNLPAEEPLTDILTEISGKTCQDGSRVVASDPQGESAQTAVPVPSGRELSLSVRDQEMVEVAGVEPASPMVSNTASTRLAILF
jgi:integrase